MKQPLHLGLLLASLWLVAGCRAESDTTALAPAEREVDLSEHFAGIDPAAAAFVVLDGRTGETIRHNPDRARRRLLPASTFKIAHALIALATGVAPEAGHTIAYDSARHRASGFWTPVWSQDHTLRSAVRNSVYWYFQEIARGIGPERMHRYLDGFEYGNCDMGGGLDRFWLRGDLRISPDEQVHFLRRFYEGTLGLPARTTEMVKDILLLEEMPQYRLSGKTGTADVTATREMAWLVGYVERGERTWFFALNMEGEEVWERWGASAARLDLVRTLLRETGVLPARGSRGE